MAAAVSTLKVLFHEELGGRQSGVARYEYVQCATADYNSILAVLNSNTKLRGGTTLVIESIVNVGVPATGVIA